MIRKKTTPRTVKLITWSDEINAGETNKKKRKTLMKKEFQIKNKTLQPEGDSKTTTPHTLKLITWSDKNQCGGDR